MAKNSQGTQVFFNDASLGEIVSVSVDGYSVDAIEITPRSSLDYIKRYRPADTDGGTATVTFLSDTSLDFDAVKTVADFSISTPASVIIAGQTALLQSLSWRASVGELQEYVAVFKLGATS